MNKLLSGAAMAAIVALALPAWAQGVTTQGQPTQQNAPGTRALQSLAFPDCPAANPGRPLTRPAHRARGSARNQPSGDQSGVAGLSPGNKSGPAGATADFRQI